MEALWARVLFPFSASHHHRDDHNEGDDHKEDDDHEEENDHGEDDDDEEAKEGLESEKQSIRGRKGKKKKSPLSSIKSSALNGKRILFVGDKKG